MPLAGSEIKTMRGRAAMQEKILIVEDETDVAELIRYNLEKESYRTIVAYSGAEALQAAEFHAPDLVLLDIMLPDLSGWDVCRALKDSPKNRSTPRRDGLGSVITHDWAALRPSTPMTSNLIAL